MDFDPEVAQRSVDFALEDGKLVLGVLIDSNSLVAQQLRDISKDDRGLANLAIALAHAEFMADNEEEQLYELIDFSISTDALLLSHQTDTYGKID